jgi:hypothetical protein
MKPNYKQHRTDSTGQNKYTQISVLFYCILYYTVH